MSHSPATNNGALILPPSVEELVVSREPLGSEKLYLLQSPDRSWVCQVNQEEPLIKRTVWRLKFIGDAYAIHAVMALNSLNFEFVDALGQAKGCVHEAGFSVAGKSIITDEQKQVLGTIVSRLKVMEFRAADGKLLANAKRSMPKGLPTFLKPSRAHLVDRYVWKRASPQPVDVRLIFAYVCLLVGSEFGRG